MDSYEAMLQLHNMKIPYLVEREKLKQTLDMEEIQKLDCVQKIEAIDLAVKALLKMTPIKIKTTNVEYENYICECSSCPTCGFPLSSLEKRHFCKHCGQAVLWEGEEDGNSKDI